MKKEIKQILFFTDDFEDNFNWKITKKDVDNGIYFYNNENNFLKFNLIRVKTFKNIINTYDCILIDYGLLDSQRRLKENINFLEKQFKNKIPMAYVGGLGGCNRYNEDAKFLFPKQKFLHNLLESDIFSNDIKRLLYRIFEK